MLPSADAATEDQFSDGAVASCQVTPASVEIEIVPSEAAATNLLPLAEDATESQAALGVLVADHVAPEFVEM